MTLVEISDCINILFYLFFCSEVWSRFLDFEKACGDLASIVNVEKRKLQTYSEVS